MMAVISVENKISIRMASIFEEVRMRLYQKGEALKRKDADYCSIQAGKDEDIDTFPTFVRSAMNEIDQAVVKRMYTFDWSIGPIVDQSSSDADANPNESSDSVSNAGEAYLVIEYIPYQRFKIEDEARMRRIVSKNIYDYVVSFVMAEWLKTVAPDLARDMVSDTDVLLFRVMKAFASLSPTVRRRATNLAGI